MKKIMLLAIILASSISAHIFADGGAFGIQLGRLTFGLGGSSRGPIIGVGPSPDNGLPFAVPFVPGDGCCSNRRCCSNRCSDYSEEYYD